MANTGNTQQIINYGATANDGLGDPLRTAFIKTEENFDNIWLAGPVGSNITITNNTIGVQNTNGNLVLSPNGVGVIQARNSIIPRIDSVYDLGGPNNYWRNIYASGISSTSLDVSGDLSIGGNLTVEGNIIEMGNIVTDAKTIQLANTAANGTQANGAGITVGSNDDIATLLYDSTGNVWTTNIGISATGNITAPYFFGNGSQLTGITSYGNADVVNLLANFGSNTISTTGNISGNLRSPGNNGQVLYNRNGRIGTSPYDFNFQESTNTLFVKVGSFSGDLNNGSDAIYGGIPGATYLGSAVMAQFTGNIESYSQVNFQNTNNSRLASGDYIITADNGNDSSYYLDLGLTSSNWDGDQPNSLGNKLGPNQGYLYVKDGNLVIGTLTNSGSNVWTFDTTGNLTAPGNIIPDTSNAYSLGNATNQWKSLYVSNTTIYINNVPISLTSGNILTVNGEPILSNDSNTTISTTGNITADYFFGNGSQLTGLNTNRILNGTSNVEIAVANGNVTVITNGTNTWNFDTSGTLNLPDLGGVIYPSISGNGVVINGEMNAPSSALLTLPHNADATTEPAGLFNGAGNVELNANSHPWLFDKDGALTLPNIGVVRSPSSSGEINVVGSDFAQLQWVDSGNLNIPDPNNTGGLTNWMYVAQYGAYIETNINDANVTPQRLWHFDLNGNLNLPNEGNIVGTTPNNSGHIQWVGNSSGDGLGYTTLRLVPDDTVEAGDQYLIIDPTAGGHIHIRAGGTQDNSLGYLFLGGENSYFQVPAGSNPSVYVTADNKSWTFGNDGNLSTPGDISALGNITAPGLLIDTVTGITANAGNVDINEITGLGGWLNAKGANISGDINGSNLNIGNISVSGNVTSNLYVDGKIEILGTLNVENTVTVDGLLVDTVSGITANGGNIDINQITSLGGWLNAYGANIGAGNIVMNSAWISDLSDPVNNQDAATKNYVDLVAQGLHVHNSCNVATTQDLASYTGATVTYDNGAGGVGATLTFSGNTLVDVDGFSLASSDRILVKNEANAVFNGIYVYSNNTVLTRATDFDTDVEGLGGDFVFVTSGNVNADTGWVQTTDAPSIGNSNIVWQQFSAAGSYTANTAAGLVLNGSQFNAKVDNISTAFDLSGNIVVKPGAILTTPNIGAATGTSLSVTNDIYANGEIILGDAVSANIVSQSAPIWITGADGQYVSINSNLYSQLYWTSNLQNLDPFSGNDDYAWVEVHQDGVFIETNPLAGDQHQWTFRANGAIDNNYEIYSDGNINATGNITAGNFIGNGSQLTSVNAVTVDVTNTNGLATTYYPTFVENRTTAQIARADVDFSYRTDTNTLSVGNISASGNITGGYILGNGAFLTGVATSYGDANVATFLANFGSNTIVTTGNITAGNLIGNISITGNVTGTSANVDVIAGSYQWTFNNTGNLVLPGNTFTVNYANGTAVSLGGSGTPGGADTNIQFNDGGSFNGTAGLTFNKTSNALATTGSITGGNGANIILGNASSYLKQNSSNASLNLSGSVSLVPDTAASALNGVVVGGSGFVLAPNSARVLTLNTNNSLTVAGNLTLGGSTGFSRFTTLGETTTGVNAIVAGQSPTILSNSAATFTANVNNYTQITFQNKNTGADATADYILTADNGSDTVNYGDFGIINSGYDVNTPTNSLGNIVFAADTYVYAQGNTNNTAQSGGNLVLGTTTAGKNVKIFAGGNNNSALVANISNTGIAVTGVVSATGNITGGNLSVTGNVNGSTNGFAIGYRDIPQVSFTANATIATSDAGKHYYSTSASNLVLTIANNASQAFAVGAAINVINLGTGTITIAQGVGVTLYFAGNSTSGNRSLASYGAGTIQKVATDTWFLVGVGVT